MALEQHKQIDNTQYLKKDKAMQYYATLFYSVQPNFTIAPSIQIQDNMKNAAGVKEGKITRIGIFCSANI